MKLSAKESLLRVKKAKRDSAHPQYMTARDFERSGYFASGSGLN